MTLDLNKRKVVETTETYTSTISRDDLKKAFNIPDRALIYFHVPGGGDWSNENIDISEDDPVHVSWVVVKVQE